MTIMVEQPQCLAALAKANVIRKSNADFIRQLRTGPGEAARFLVAAALVEPDDATGALPVRRLLLGIPRFGAARAGRYLRAAGIVSGDRRVRDLSDRQRQQLARWLHAGVGFGRGAFSSFDDRAAEGEA